MSQRRIYLDHAATSWPKSEAVLAAMDHFHRTEGAAAGRGTYAAAFRASAGIAQCRRRIARMIDADDETCISFHSNATAALNAAIHGLIRPGDHVVTTAAEHNSVLRPLTYLQENQRVRLTIVPCDAKGSVDANEVIDAVGPDTRMVAVTHASNVTGAMQPIEEIGFALKEKDVAVLCDAAQTFGYMPISLKEMNVDLFVAPGHKGGAGPLGTAMLYCHPRWHDELRPTIQGGTGSQSESLTMPESMPDKLESGNLNVPAIVGWDAGLRELTDEVLTATASRFLDLSAMLYRRLAKIPHVNVIGPSNFVPLVSLTIDGMSPSDISAVLDSDFGIETRAGFHCAALIHHYINTEQDGTLRISAGRETSDDEIDRVIDAIKDIAFELNR